MRVQLRANAEVDLLNQAELDKSLRDPALVASYWSERGRAEKYLEQTFTFVTPPAISATAGVVLVDGAGNGSPRAGYAWAVRTLSVNLAAAQIVNFWKVADPGLLTAASYIKGTGQGQAAAVVNSRNWSSLQFVLKPGEYVALSAQGATTLSAAWLVAVEVPEPELWKVE